MHARVEFDVDIQRMRLGQGHVLHRLLDELQITETEHLWFKMIFDDVVVAVHLWTHHHDG